MVKAVVSVLFLVLVILGAAFIVVEPTKASPPSSLEAVASFGDVLAPGSSKNYTLSLTGGYDNLLLYAKGGDNNADDTFDVTFTASGNSPWPSIQGEVWFLTGPISPGQYNVTVAVNPNASAAISFQVTLYKTPDAPVDFSGDFLQSSSYTSSSVLFTVASDGVYGLNMTAFAGDFEISLDGNSLGVVTNANATSQELTAGTHELDITADPLGQSPVHDQWFLQIGPSTGPLTPTLSVDILPSCATNASNETVCTLTAQVTASDGKNVTANYQWSSDGGTFDSNSSQVVEWTAPFLNQTQTYQINCNATAQGYLGSSASVPINASPVPEFESGATVLFTVSFAAALMACRSPLRRRKRSECRYSR